MSSTSDTETFAKPEALFRVPVGLASPLWGLFAGAAMTGAAWWWMTRWTQVENLEAMFGATAEAPVDAEVEPVLPASSVAETIAAVAEIAPEAMIEAAGETARVVEALVEAPVGLQPVGGEAAPISPVLEALAPDIAQPQATDDSATPMPKPKKKPSEAQGTDKLA